jgi:hypothetical protein
MPRTSARMLKAGVVPAIFDLEVCAALVRRGIPLPRVEQFLAAHVPDRHRVVIGPRAACRGHCGATVSGLPRRAMVA